jgi:hypothetical protein
MMDNEYINFISMSVQKYVFYNDINKLKNILEWVDPTRINFSKSIIYSYYLGYTNLVKILFKFNQNPLVISECFYISSNKNDFELIKLLFTLNKHYNEINKNELLMSNACYYNNLELIHFLKEKGIEVAGNSLTSIINSGNLNLLKYVYKKSYVKMNVFKENYFNMLLVSCKYKRISILNFLIFSFDNYSKELNENNTFKLIETCCKYHKQDINVFIYLMKIFNLNESNIWSFIFSMAVEHSNVLIIKYIKTISKNNKLSKDDINKGFIFSVSNKNQKIINLILDNYHQCIDTNNENIQNTLMKIIHEGNYNLINKLVKYSLINVVIDKAFIFSNYNKRIEIVELLLQNGANIHYNNNEALIDACFLGNLSLFNLLIEYGANIYDRNGEAFDVAIEYKNNNIIQSLFNLLNQID